MLLDDDELKKYFLKQNREMGRPGWRAGLGPPDMYGNQSPHTQEGWKDLTRQQLETNQFGPDLPRGLGLLESREQAEQVLGHRLEDNMGPQLYQSPTDMMSADGIPRGPQLGEISAMNQQLAFGGGHPDELSLAQAPKAHGYDQFIRRPPGLLESSGEIISQTLPPGQSTTEEDWQKQGWDTQSTGEGGKWETEDSIFRRKKKEKNGMENYMAKYLMQLGNQISSDEDAGWRRN